MKALVRFSRDPDSTGDTKINTDILTEGEGRGQGRNRIDYASTSRGRVMRYGVHRWRVQELFGHDSGGIMTCIWLLHTERSSLEKMNPSADAPR
jgi:hypothetical protein